MKIREILIEEKNADTENKINKLSDNNKRLEDSNRELEDNLRRLQAENNGLMEEKRKLSGRPFISKMNDEIIKDLDKWRLFLKDVNNTDPAFNVAMNNIYSLEKEKELRKI